MKINKIKHSKKGKVVPKKTTKTFVFPFNLSIIKPELYKGKLW